MKKTHLEAKLWISLSGAKFGVELGKPFKLKLTLHTMCGTERNTQRPLAYKGHRPEASGPEETKLDIRSYMACSQTWLVRFCRTMCTALTIYFWSGAACGRTWPTLLVARGMWSYMTFKILPYKAPEAYTVAPILPLDGWLRISIQRCSLVAQLLPPIPNRSIN